MKAKVDKILTELVIRLDRKWQFHGLSGNKVKIKGLIPSSRNKQKESTSQLSDLILGKEIEVYQALFVSGGTLSAIVKYNNIFIQNYFEERKVSIPPTSRLVHPEESRKLTRVLGGIPDSHWKNPIANLELNLAPFLGNISYPTKVWEKDYDELKKVSDALYSNSHHNKSEIDRWFSKFLTDKRREAPVLIVGEVGIGKSWLLSNKLMSLPQEKYHVVIIDLRNNQKGNVLLDSLNLELNEYLNYYIKDLSWIYPDFMSIFGEDFDPTNQGQKQLMQQAAAQLPLWEKNRRRLRYYSQPGSPDLIIAFDNIDHYTVEEQENVVELCRQIYGSKCGIRAIFAIRPTTMTLKNRLEIFFGDQLSKSIHLRSPNIYEVLTKRLTTNYKGDTWDINDNIPNINMSWSKLLSIYRTSDNAWGLAGFIRSLCTTISTTPADSEASISPYIIAEHEQEVHTKYDLRHYLRLFRRVIRSDWLQDLENIKQTYFGIQALMLRGDEPMSESESYLFNLFDNEEPLYPGNALIRYRVLEYCVTLQDRSEEVFNNYFMSLGYDTTMVCQVVKMFESAGLIETTYHDETKKMPKKSVLTIPGRRHLEIVTNLWYIICAKTGMYIYDDFILYNHEAIEQAKEYVRSERTLDYYGKHGWVPEDKLISYLAHEETLEEIRVGEFQQMHTEWAGQVSNWLKDKSYPSTNIYYSYNVQIHNWRRHRSGHH
jgi:hypothetical protein